jgi:hypothetical protein
LATSAFFLAYVAFAVGVPPAEHDCTAHFFPTYVPARILDVFIWLVLSWAFWEYTGRRWLWSSFFSGGFAGGGFGLVVLPVWWLTSGLIDALHWVRALGSIVTYAIIAGLFAGGIPSRVRSSMFGLLVLVLQVIVDTTVHPFCVY